MARSVLRRIDRIRFERPLALFLAAAVAFVVFAAPDSLVPSLPGVPPLALRAALALFAAPLLGLGAHRAMRKPRPAAEDQDADEAPPQPVRMRRADSHPDAPPREPIRASLDLGSPLMEVPVFADDDADAESEALSAPEAIPEEVARDLKLGLLDAEYIEIEFVEEDEEELAAPREDRPTGGFASMVEETLRAARARAETADPASETMAADAAIPATPVAAAPQPSATVAAPVVDAASPARSDPTDRGRAAARFLSAETIAAIAELPAWTAPAAPLPASGGTPASDGQTEAEPRAERETRAATTLPPAFSPREPRLVAVDGASVDAFVPEPDAAPRVARPSIDMLMDRLAAGLERRRVLDGGARPAAPSPAARTLRPGLRDALDELNRLAARRG